MKRILTTLSQKWPEYLLEILVITVGILGAFALNNWNENYKNQNKERTLLLNLERDFTLRHQELLEFKEARKKALVSINDLYEAIANQNNLPPKSKLDTCIVNITNAMTFNDQFKMLDALFSTGMINDLQNEDLKQRLLLWPQQVEEMMEEQRSRQSLYLQFLEPLLLEYVAIREIFELISFRGYSTPKGTTVTYPSNYAGLLSEPSFERYLARLESLLIVNDIDSNILIENAEQILILLNQETKP
jgi:hypothetical protein